VCFGAGHIALYISVHRDHYVCVCVKALGAQQRREEECNADGGTCISIHILYINIVIVICVFCGGTYVSIHSISKYRELCVCKSTRRTAAARGGSLMLAAVHIFIILYIYIERERERE